MTDYQDKLIDLYARHKVQDISANSKLLEELFNKSLNELAHEVVGFSNEQERIQNLKIKIEERKFDLNAKNQVSTALKMLLEMVMFPEVENEEKLEIMKQLFLLIFNNDWSESQKEHFNFVFSLLKEWDSYFISYTNHYAIAINDKYRNIIRRNIPKEMIKQHKEKYNLLAEAILNQLKKNNLCKCFFDREKIKIGDNLDGTLSIATTKTFAFIQLIQPEIFICNPDRKNWCFLEYKNFLKVTPSFHGYSDIFNKRYKAILAGDDVINNIPPMIPSEYFEWKARIFNNNLYLILPLEPSNFDKAMKDLASSIVNLCNQIIENVPD